MSETTAVIDRSAARRAGASLALASILAIAGFTVLGSVFEYPQILDEPVADVLTLFREHQTMVMTWFGALVISSALMAPAGYWLGRLAGGTLGRWITALGIAATLLDSVMGCCIHTTLKAGIGYTTVEIKVNYVRAMTDKTGPVKAEGRVINVGSRIGTSEGKLYDGAGKLLAHGTTTCLIFPI